MTAFRLKVNKMVLTMTGVQRTLARWTVRVTNNRLAEIQDAVVVLNDALDDPDAFVEHTVEAAEVVDDAMREHGPRAGSVIAALQAFLKRVDPSLLDGEKYARWEKVIQDVEFAVESARDYADIAREARKHVCDLELSPECKALIAHTARFAEQRERLGELQTAKWQFESKVDFINDLISKPRRYGPDWEKVAVAVVEALRDPEMDAVGAAQRATKHKLSKRSLDSLRNAVDGLKRARLVFAPFN